jgi:mono/diheme cytochrome c family protein
MIRALLLALLVLPASALAVEVGDAAHGAALFRLHCAGCHGTDAAGQGFLSKSLKAPAPANLRDPALLLGHSDQALYDAVAKGGAATGGSFTMPAFGEDLGSLDLWDLVAFLRKGQVKVADFFPAAARYAVKTYAIDADGQKRVEPVVGQLSPEELKVPVVAIFGGAKPPDAPLFVSQDPRALDSLKPKEKVGYISFVSIAWPGGKQIPATLAFDREGVLTAVRLTPGALPEKELAKAQKLASGFEGQGSKKGPFKELKAPKGAAGKEGAELAKAMSRAYYRALEGAVMFDKEERERHWAD